MVLTADLLEWFAAVTASDTVGPHPWKDASPSHAPTVTTAPAGLSTSHELILALAGDADLNSLRAQFDNTLELSRLDLQDSLALQPLLTVGDEPGARQTLVSLPLGESQDALAAVEVMERIPGVIWAEPYYEINGDDGKFAVKQARAYLMSQADELQLSTPTLADLSHVFSQDLSFGSVERFEQQVNDIPVYESEIAVTVADNGTVTYVYNSYQPALQLADSVASITADEARASALSSLGITGPLNHDSNKLIVFPTGDGARLAYQVWVVPVDGSGDFEVIVDAANGSILQSKNRASNATGTGMVFNPDPLSKANVTYGATGYTDNNDADTTQLNNQRESVTLQDITLNAGTYSLVGPYAQIVDVESPTEGLFTQTSNTFNFTRSQAGFEAVNLYYHLDRFMRYLNVTLGLNVRPTQYTGGAKFDPHGLNGEDNAHYDPSNGVVSFGEGGVDDAEDADIAVHELGHGIHDWVTGGNLSQVNGLSEGTGDYFSQSYSRALGSWPSTNPAYHWVANWDGHNEFWSGRVTNYAAVYPGGLTGTIHTDGQIWSTANMKVWDVLGAAKTDAIMVEGLAMTGSSTNQQQAAQALLQAAFNRGYTAAELNSIYTIYTAAGYTVTLPTPPTQLTGTVWNDLNGNRTREAGENAQTGWTVYLDTNNNGSLDGGSGNRAATNPEVPKPIADLSTVTSQIVVTGLSGNITDLNVTLSLTHTYDSDLIITLIAPGGQRVELASYVGSNGDNFTNTIFDQQAATSITSGSAPFTGTFRPEGSLSSLNNTAANGTWRLEIVDDAGGDSGTLTAWSLQFTTGEPSTVTPASGTYLFSNLAAGNYVIREVVQASWTQTVPVTGSHSVTLATGQTLSNLDFANTQGNSAPTISNIPDQTIAEDGSVLANFTIGDAQTATSALVLSATTSNATLLPLGNIVFGGSAGNRTVALTPAANEFGTATVTVTVTDGGALTAQDTILLTVNSVNDVPSFTRGADQNVPMNAGPQFVAGWATAISAGPSNESSQTFSFNIVTNSNSALFSTPPAVAPNGTLTYAPAAGATGSATITLAVQDSGGTANGGVDTSATQTFTITVTAPATFQVTGFTPTTTGVVLDVNRDLDPSTLNLYDVEAGTLGPPDVTLVGNATGNVRGSLVVDPSLRRLTLIRTAGTLAQDTYTLTLRSAADGFRDSTSALLDGDANGTAGGNYTQTFVVGAPPVGGVTVGLPNFVRGPQQAVAVPANAASGFPLTVSDGAGLTSATVNIAYNPALLTISGGTLPAGLPAGAAVNVNVSTPGLAIVTFTSSTPLATGAAELVRLQATVPPTATYRSKHVLDITSAVLNAGSIPVITDDALHVVAYFGDTTGNGTYSAQDASRVARLAVGLDTGLQPYKLTDPAVVADISGNGLISATDTSRILQAGVGIATAEIPPLPDPAVSLTQGGPDPKLSIPTNLVATPGAQVSIPVMIDSIVDLTGNGLESADLVIYYDAAALEVTSVTLGGLLTSAPGNWFVAANIDPLAGRAIISLAGQTPLESLFEGELVHLNTQVKDHATGSIALNLAASSRSPAQHTQLNEGYLTLIPAPTDAANDSVDGLLTILSAASETPVQSARTARDLALLQLVSDYSARTLTPDRAAAFLSSARIRRR